MPDDLPLPLPLPTADAFPPGTEFIIYEFDSPLANVPGRGWESWWGGWGKPYDPRPLKPGNNWLADSFAQWLEVVEETMKPPPGSRSGQ
ncbi:MAG: hypothetical protein K8R60_06315 [Burkholderiales bacterium]|nr:hypothetical protein [Burkholderiales bacterium]